MSRSLPSLALALSFLFPRYFSAQKYHRGEGDNQCEENHKGIWSWNLPEDISFIIFSRLPVKSVMQCMCVCKSWHTWISTQHFVNMHRLLASSGAASHCTNPDIVFIDFCGIDKLQWTLCMAENFGAQNERVRPLPLPSHLTSFMLVDSCNGLLCLVNYSDYRHSFYIFNPCTGKSTHIPSSPSRRQSSSGRFYGFGYDPILDEYKILEIFFEENSISKHVKQVGEVWKLGTDSWRRTTEIPFTPYRYRSRSYFMDGTLYWMAFDIDETNLVGLGSFHVGKEEFQFVPLPREIFADVDCERLEVGVLGGYISVANFSFADRAEIWVTNNCKSMDSWTRIFVLLNEPENMSFIDQLCIFKNWEFLFCNEDKKLACDFQIRKVPDTGIAFIHIGTLVSPVSER